MYLFNCYFLASAGGRTPSFGGATPSFGGATPLHSSDERGSSAWEPSATPGRTEEFEDYSKSGPYTPANMYGSDRSSYSPFPSTPSPTAYNSK